jgi:hypothetical protein
MDLYLNGPIQKSVEEDSESSEEMSTINLIDQLNFQQKKCLNNLVLSVLKTQKDNEEDKLKLINLKRDVIKQLQLVEQDKLEYERQKIKLIKIMNP